MTDAWNQLEAAGFPVDRIPDAQKNVLSSLSDDEVRVLTDVKRRLDDATDVEAHQMARGDTGYVFW